MANTAELLQFEEFMESLQKAIVENSGLYFSNHDICVLNDTYYIKISEEEIEIRSQERQLIVSNESSCLLNLYYNSLKALLNDMYYEKISNMKYILRINFMLKRIRKRLK